MQREADWWDLVDVITSLRHYVPWQDGYHYSGHSGKGGFSLEAFAVYEKQVSVVR